MVYDVYVVCTYCHGTSTTTSALNFATVPIIIIIITGRDMNMFVHRSRSVNSKNNAQWTVKTNTLCLRSRHEPNECSSSTLPLPQPNSSSHSHKVEDKLNNLLVTIITILLVSPRGDAHVYVPDSCCWISLMVRRYLIPLSSATFDQPVYTTKQCFLHIKFLFRQYVARASQ